LLQKYIEEDQPLALASDGGAEPNQGLPPTGRTRSFASSIMDSLIDLDDLIDA
jgi:hypothetical protein